MTVTRKRLALYATSLLGVVVMLSARDACSQQVQQKTSPVPAQWWNHFVENVSTTEYPGNVVIDGSCTANAGSSPTDCGGGGGGGVTSVGVLGVNLAVSGSPITSSGNITVTLTSAGIIAALGYTPASAGGGILWTRNVGTSSGETLAGGFWTQRVLNVTPLNTIAGASVSGNAITLPAGTYEITAQATAQEPPSAGSGMSHQMRVYDETSSSVLFVGPTNIISYDDTTMNPFVESLMGFEQGFIVLSGTDTIEIDSFLNGAGTGGAPTGGASTAFVDVIVKTIP